MRWALISDLALGAAVASLGAAAWFYLSAPHGALNVTPRADGAALRFDFVF